MKTKLFDILHIDDMMYMIVLPVSNTIYIVSISY
jgi:hypothetical protein